ncbi:unnamed protein product [Microthlaspi erraticum]|uniref:Uncharacterized protein n=1 Tax=Microthlaspi erraticum TaxID=1685480 RepID=A0A6D2I4F0_9BRAS|nr:unnamed protein product [Microthlaspi erraticum]
MRESSHRPLIFGTPFLSTVGAIFDFPNQRISFNKRRKLSEATPKKEKLKIQSRKIPFLSPSSLPLKQGVRLRPLHQNRPRDHPRLKMRPSQEGRIKKPRSGRNMKLLFPKELIDENLEGFKEKVTRTLQLFPKAFYQGTFMERLSIQL